MNTRFRVLAVLILMAVPFSSPANHRQHNQLETRATGSILNMDSPTRIPGRFIVVFNDEVSRREVAAEADALASRSTGRSALIEYVTINGFAANLDEETLARFSGDHRVAYIEADQVVYSQSTWGLDRIDQCDLPLDNNYNSNGLTGLGVHVYIVDNGVCDHNDFTGRLQPTGFVSPASGDPCASGSNGHGTGMAGVVGGRIHGVAKQAVLHDIQVLNSNGSGSISQVLAGIDWVTVNHIAPAVANLSLGAGASTTLDNAVDQAVAAGVLVTVVAGNSNTDACNFSPGRSRRALTVAASREDDQVSPSTNFGPCVDLYAPGNAITTTWNTGPNSTVTISGSSLAAAHAAGVAALVRQAYPGWSAGAVYNEIIAWAVPDRLIGVPADTPNLLLQNQDNACPPLCLPNGATCGMDADCCSGNCTGWFTQTCN